MGEFSVDILGRLSKHLDTYLDQEFDVVATTCDFARETCPTFPGGGEILHHSLQDPAGAAGSKEEILSAFRRVRDDIDQWIQETSPRTLLHRSRIDVTRYVSESIGTFALVLLDTGDIRSAEASLVC